MKKVFAIISVLFLAISCGKTTTTPTPTSPTTTGCGDGSICFKLNGTDISKTGGGYELSDTNLFVKYEGNNTQLSIDIFGKTTGNYTVTDARKKGNARIYYFPVASSSTDTLYIAETGSLNITAYDASARKISGTFSGTLYNYNNSTLKFIKTDSVVIKDGIFTNVSVPKI